VNCGANVIVQYAGGRLTLTDNSTNYIFLDATNSCAPTFNTSGFPELNAIPLDEVTTRGGTIVPNGITKARTKFVLSSGGETTTTIRITTPQLLEMSQTHALNAATPFGGNTNYAGTFSNCSTANALVGGWYTVSGFTKARNNGGPFPVISCNPTSLVLANPSGVAETASATAVNFGFNVVPPPGNGIVIVPVAMAAQYKPGTRPFTVTNAAVSSFYTGANRGSVINYALELEPDQFFNRSDNPLWFTTFWGWDVNQIPLSSVNNMPIVMALTPTKLNGGDGTMWITTSWIPLPVR
jgi:hypothetical protein